MRTTTTNLKIRCPHCSALVAVLHVRRVMTTANATAQQRRATRDKLRRARTKFSRWATR